MDFKPGRKFWIALTVVIVGMTLFVVARNLLHIVQIKAQIGRMNQERDGYQDRIAQDSTLIERLRYDDFLEEYARENYHMQRRDERVYVIKD